MNQFLLHMHRCLEKRMNFSDFFIYGQSDNIHTRVVVIQKEWTVQIRENWENWHQHMQTQLQVELTAPSHVTHIKPHVTVTGKANWHGVT